MPTPGQRFPCQHHRLYNRGFLLPWGDKQASAPRFEYGVGIATTHIGLLSTAPM